MIFSFCQPQKRLLYTRVQKKQNEITPIFGRCIYRSRKYLPSFCLVNIYGFYHLRQGIHKPFLSVSRVDANPLLLQAVLPIFRYVVIGIYGMDFMIGQQRHYA